MKAIMAYYSYYHPLCTLMRTLSQLVLWVVVATVVAHFTFIVAVSRQTFKSLLLLWEWHWTWSKAWTPSHGHCWIYVDFVISSLLKIKVTLFIFISIPRCPLHTSLFISSLLTLDNLITIHVNAFFPVYYYHVPAYVEHSNWYRTHLVEYVVLGVWSTRTFEKPLKEGIDLIFLQFSVKLLSSWKKIARNSHFQFSYQNTLKRPEGQFHW